MLTKREIYELELMKALIKKPGFATYEDAAREAQQAASALIKAQEKCYAT